MWNSQSYNEPTTTPSSQPTNPPLIHINHHSRSGATRWSHTHIYYYYIDARRRAFNHTWPCCGRDLLYIHPLGNIDGSRVPGVTHNSISVCHIVMTSCQLLFFVGVVIWLVWCAGGAIMLLWWQFGKSPWHDCGASVVIADALFGNAPRYRHDVKQNYAWSPSWCNSRSERKPGIRERQWPMPSCHSGTFLTTAEAPFGSACYQQCAIRERRCSEPRHNLRA